jgi:hypothetical protein
MADTKISGLPASTTPLVGTEVLPIVQGGVTKQVSVANLTAGRTTATNAIQFPATPVLSADPNTLDDYEEGTFTPTLHNATTTTYTTQTGRYTRVGRLVTFQCELEINSIGDGSTLNFVLGTLPNTDHFSTISVGFFANLANAVSFLTGYINNTSNVVTMQSTTIAAASSISVAVFGNSTRIIVSGQYSV